MLKLYICIYKYVCLYSCVLSCMCRYDEAQLRFAKGSKLADNFYVRQDGTCAYFFTTEELQKLAANAGLATEECYYIQR